MVEVAWAQLLGEQNQSQGPLMPFRQMTHRQSSLRQVSIPAIVQNHSVVNHFASNTFNYTLKAPLGA